MLIFHDSALSPYAQKVKIALMEKGIAFERRLPDLANPDDHFLKASPRREVPAIEHDGRYFFDSTIILHYLEDAWPQPPLLPEAAPARARVRTLEEVCDTRLEAAIFCLNEIYVLKRDFGSAAATIEAEARKEVGSICDWLDAQLAAAPCFNGGQFGYGDICVYPFVRIAQQYKTPLRGGLSEWLQRTRARDSVRRVEAEAREERPLFLELAAKVPHGEWTRHYRDHRMEAVVRVGGLEAIVQGIRDRSISTAVFDDLHGTGERSGDIPAGGQPK